MMDKKPSAGVQEQMKLKLYDFFYEENKRDRNLFLPSGRMRPDDWPPENWNEREYEFFEDKNKRKIPLWLRDCPTVEYWRLARRFVEPLMREWSEGENPFDDLERMRKLAKTRIY